MRVPSSFRVTLIRSAFSLALGTSVSGPAQASLTASEKAQIAGFVRDGLPGNAARARATIARPDLTPEEAAEPLVEGYSRVSFGDRHVRFTRALLFGPGSDAARSALVPAVTRALLARANRAFAELPAAGWDARAERLADEIVGIHAFVSAQFANAGKPPPDGHDVTTGIRDDALRDAVLLYKRHLEENGRWLRQGAVSDKSLLRVRAQARLTAIDLARGLVPRHELSGWLGLDGARRGLFERRGVLLDDGGSAPEPRIALAARLIESAPIGTRDVSLWLIHKTPTGGLVARGRIARARVGLGAAPEPAPAERYWSDEVEPARPDAAMAEVALSIGWAVARNVLATSPAWRARAQRATERAITQGETGFLARDLPASLLGPSGSARAPAGATPELVLAHAIRLVLLDLPRAMTLAQVRAAEGQSAPLEQLALALGALALDDAGKPRKELTACRTGKDGALEQLAVSKLEVSDAIAVKFSIGKTDYALVAGAGGGLALRVNGAEPKLSTLEHFRLRPRALEKWSALGGAYDRLFGQPEAAVIDGRFVLVAPAESGGFDAVATGSEVSDVRVSAKLRPLASGGGVILRGRAGPSSYAGIALFVSGEAPRAQLVAVDGKGRAIELAPALALAEIPAQGIAIEIESKGDLVRAVIDGKRLEAKLTRAFEPGRVGFTVRPGGRLEVWSLSIDGKPAGSGDKRDDAVKKKTK